MKIEVAHIDNRYSFWKYLDNSAEALDRKHPCLTQMFKPKTPEALKGHKLAQQNYEEEETNVIKSIRNVW